MALISELLTRMAHECVDGIVFVRSSILPDVRFGSMCSSFYESTFCSPSVVPRIDSQSTPSTEDSMTAYVGFLGRGMSCQKIGISRRRHLENPNGQNSTLTAPLVSSSRSSRSTLKSSDDRSLSMLPYHVRERVDTLLKPSKNFSLYWDIQLVLDDLSGRNGAHHERVAAEDERSPKRAEGIGVSNCVVKDRKFAIRIERDSLHPLWSA